MASIKPLDDFSTLLPPKAEDQAASQGELAQADFLKLMITQFQNQDPFKPMENGEFLGQIAQFSTVSGIEDLNSSFSTLSSSIQEEQALKAASLVGRSVMAYSDVGYLGDVKPLMATVDLDEPASSVQVDIKDASGEVIQRLNLGQQPAGPVDFAWNGLDAEGNSMPSGNYEISARVIRGTQVESVQTLVHADVASVTLGQQGRGMTLNLEGGGELALSKIYRIN